jgi:hypothetical protein
MNPPPTFNKEQFEAQLRGNLSKETADYIMGLFVESE